MTPSPTKHPHREVCGGLEDFLRELEHRDIKSDARILHEKLTQSGWCLAGRCRITILSGAEKLNL